MNRNLRMLFVIAILAPLTVYGDDVDVAILQTGTFHGDEVHVDTSAPWWGLFVDRDGARLERVDVAVHRVRDELLDADGEKTAKRVTVTGPEQPVFLLSGVANLREGPIHSVFDGRRFLYPGEMQRIGKDGIYRAFIAASGRATAGEHGSRFEEYALTLWYWGGGRPIHQEIARVPTFSMEGRPELLWAGDLDGDDRPDLIFDLRTHYNVSELTLFVSSAADDGKAVTEAARLVTTGC